MIVRTEDPHEDGFLHDPHTANLFSQGLSDPRGCCWCGRFLEWFRHGRVAVMACANCDPELL